MHACMHACSRCTCEHIQCVIAYAMRAHVAHVADVAAAAVAAAVAAAAAILPHAVYVRYGHE